MERLMIENWKELGERDRTKELIKLKKEMKKELEKKISKLMEEIIDIDVEIGECEGYLRELDYIDGEYYE